MEKADSPDPHVLSAWELTPGREYYILLTTSSGFYRYNIRDVVRCTGFHGDAPLLEFLHKGAHISSITGEKISESQVVEAVRAAQADSGLCTTQFTMTPEWLDQPGYTLYVDLRRHTESTQLERFASLVEQQLCSRNEEYREKRQTGRLGAHPYAGSARICMANSAADSAEKIGWQCRAIQAPMPDAGSRVSQRVPAGLRACRGAASTDTFVTSTVARN